MITVGNKQYKVLIVKSEEDKIKGLSGRKELAADEGMLFDFSDNVGEKSFWMKDTSIPLDIVFINDDEEVISVHTGTPNDETLITELDVAYVLEVNANSGIKPEDELEIEDDSEDDPPIMKVLNQDGSTQLELWGGERIISRIETKVIIKKAKKADLSKADKDYKALGRYIFKVIKGLDTRPAEYVESAK